MSTIGGVMGRLRDPFACLVLVVVVAAAACGSATGSAPAQNAGTNEACTDASNASDASIASAPAATSLPTEQSAPSTTTIPEDLKATLRAQALHTQMANEALGDGLAAATATDVVPWYVDDSLAGYAVMITLARPQDVAPATPVPGIPGPYSDVTSVWVTLTPTGEAKSVSVIDGALSPDVELPIVDPAGLCE
jgi:hypothetical protein